MVRNAELSLGSYLKIPTAKEIENSRISRKKIIAATSIEKGEIFTDRNLITLRSNKGVSSVYWDNVIGKKATKRYARNEPILFDTK